MKNLLTALALTLTLSAAASAARHTDGAIQTANPAAICDRLHEYGSPAWQACRSQFFADASSLICGREPQLDICKRGQLLSLIPRCPPGTIPGVDCRHLLVSNEKVGPLAGAEKVGAVKTAAIEAAVLRASSIISFDGETGR